MRFESDILMQGNQVKVLADAVDAADAVTKSQMEAAIAAVTPIDLTSEVTGVLPVASGGTGLSALGAAGQVMRVKADLSGLEWGDAGLSGSGVDGEIAIWSGGQLISVPRLRWDDSDWQTLTIGKNPVNTMGGYSPVGRIMFDDFAEIGVYQNYGSDTRNDFSIKKKVSDGSWVTIFKSDFNDKVFIGAEGYNTRMVGTLSVAPKIIDIGQTYAVFECYPTPATYSQYITFEAKAAYYTYSHGFEFRTSEVGNPVQDAFRIESNGQLLVRNRMEVAKPDYSFSGDTNTGLYSPAADTLAISTGGTERLSVSTSSVDSSLPVHIPDGSVGAPALVFGSGTNGLYLASAGELAFAANGKKVVTFLDVTDEFAPLGPELLADNTWTMTSGVTGTWSTGFTHTPGTTDTITFENITFSTGKVYVFVVTRQGGTNNQFIGVTIDGGQFVLSTGQGNSTYTDGIKALASGYKLQITFPDTYDGTVFLSLKEIVGDAPGQANFYIGNNYKGKLKTGDKVVGFGENAGKSISVNTSDNTFFGRDAGKNLVTGYRNTIIGRSAFQEALGIHGNTVIGAYAADVAGKKGNVTGLTVIGEHAIGNYEGTNIYITAIGASCAKNYTDGSPATDLGSYSLYLGAFAKATPNALYETVIGALNKGRGAYSTVIGHSSGYLYSNSRIACVQLGSQSQPAYTFDGDTNTGLYSPAADTLSITTGSTERLQVNNAFTQIKQEVFIDEDLHVGGTMLISNGSAGVPAIAPTSDGDTGIYFDGAGGTYISSDGNAVFSLTGSSLAISVQTTVSGALITTDVLAAAGGKMSFADAASTPTAAGELWRSGPDFLWHDGTSVKTIATREWVDESGGRFFTMSPIGHTTAWTDGALVAFFRESAWKNIVEIRASVYTAPTEPWRIGLYVGGSLVTYLNFNTGDTEASVSFSPPHDTAGALVELKTEMSPGTTGGAPEGLTLFINAKK